MAYSFYSLILDRMVKLFVLFVGPGLVGENWPTFGFRSVDWIFGVLVQCIIS
jgi:hypothetical protein